MHCGLIIKRLVN